MKRILILLSLCLICALGACVKESPEPIYHPETDPSKRALVGSTEIAGVSYALYNDGTGEVSAVEGSTAKSLTIPETVGNHTVVAICDEVFREATFTHVTLPSTLRSIGKRAFQRSLVTEITLPDSVTSLGEEAFDNCLRLEKVIFGKGLKTIPVGCFYGCSALTDISLPEGIEAVEEEAFASLGKASSLSLPSTLKTIGDFAFWNFGEKSLAITLPEGLETLGESAFEGNYKHSLSYGGESESVKNALKGEEK